MTVMRNVLFALLFAAAAFRAEAGTGRVVIMNVDAPGVGFNDLTPVAPVGGNTGTTLGQQRLNVFQAAADRWSSLLETNVDIVVQASFAPISGCTETDAILGQAAPFNWKRDFENAPRPGVWYPIALANALAGKDLDATPEIFTQFNGDVDNATCLGNADWYYGLDGNHGGDMDLFVVVLHEIAHGLGVSSAGRSGDTFREGFPSTFDTNLRDLSTGQLWPQMSAEQRRISINNTAKLVWDGPNVREHAARLLYPVTMFNISQPANLAGNYDIGTATFGPSIAKSTVSGRLIQATDAANAEGPTTLDGCTAFTNAAVISGNVAVVDRGTCTFASKARNAQAAGATALIILDVRRETCTPPAMGGSGDDVTIPVISLGVNDGDVLRAQLNAAEVKGSLLNDPTQMAGASRDGLVRLYAPCTTAPGSSKHHWDTPASPNLLMEPSVNSDLLHGVDLTMFMLMDMGWKQAPRSGRRTARR